MVPEHARSVVLTPRLEIRLPTESDRARFVELFGNEGFMVFSSGVLKRAAAHERFDEMLLRAEDLDFALQPVIERSTGTIVGYSNPDRPQVLLAGSLARAYRARGVR